MPFNPKKVPKPSTPVPSATPSQTQTFYSVDLLEDEDYVLEYPKVTPFGLLTLVLMTVTYLLQFIGMVFHRLSTLGHIVSTTDLGLLKVSRLLHAYVLAMKKLVIVINSK